jgi:hypothetical protein
LRDPAETFAALRNGAGQANVPLVRSASAACSPIKYSNAEYS